MNTCDACKHWRAPEPDDEDNWYKLQPNEPHSGSVDIPNRDGEWGVCMRTVYGWSESYSYQDHNSLALAHDHEDYAAELLTRPSFGCIQYQPKDTP